MTCPRPRHLLTLLFAAAVALAAMLAGPTPWAQAAAGAPPRITVHGSQLFFNGGAWVPRGVQIVGLVAPDSALRDKYVPAHAHFGTPELQAAVADHADVVRFQVSQFGIDPDGQLYSPAYVREVINGVEAARSLGLAVIVSLQAEAPAGEPGRCPLPDAGAERAWQQLAPAFAGDSGVMLELYNEPAVPAWPPDWALWLNGGEVHYPNGSCAAVGMQTLVDEIRAEGAGNVIIVPGLAGEQTLSRMPKLTDPSSPTDPQLAFGIHYPSLSNSSESWDRQFGNLSGRVPVIVTEWLANSTTNCNADAPTGAPRLLDYLASKRIGIVGFAFDLPGTIVADWSYTPTSYSGFACGKPNGGPGQLLFGQYAAEGASGDGSSLAPSPAWIINAQTLTRLHELSPPTAEHFFNTPRAYVTGASAASLAPLGVPTAIPTASFTNFTNLIGAVNGHTLPPGTQAVVYAPTHSLATPAEQQHDPASFFELAGQAAHAQGLLFVAAPSLTLVKTLAPHTPAAKREKEFLKIRVAADAARYADAFEVPAQGLEGSPERFAGFVGAAARQAGRAHHGVELLSGLRTGSPTGRLNAKAVFSLYLRMPGSISGFALTDSGAAPAGGSCAGRCPGGPGDQGLALLRRVQGLQNATGAGPAAVASRSRHRHRPRAAR